MLEVLGINALGIILNLLKLGHAYNVVNDRLPKLHREAVQLG
jgi:hypothetical protein